MKKLQIAVSAVALSAALLPSLAAAQNIAIVNGKAVPKARFDTLMTQITKQGNQPRTPDLERQVKDELVLREIFVQEAERAGVQRSDEYKQQMDLARQSLMIRELFTSYQKKNPVTDEQLKAEYDKLKGQNSGKEYRARHILVEKEDEAKALVAKIKGGAKFEDLAKEKSKDPGSGANGGDLDFAKPENYVPEFGQAMTKLKKGEMTETPIKTQFGWHIIKLEETREAQFPEFDAVKGELQKRIGQAKLQKFQEELMKAAKTDYKFGGQ